MVAQTFNPLPQETESERSLSIEASLVYKLRYIGPVLNNYEAACSSVSQRDSLRAVISNHWGTQIHRMYAGNVSWGEVAPSWPALAPQSCFSCVFVCFSSPSARVLQCWKIQMSGDFRHWNLLRRGTGFMVFHILSMWESSYPNVCPFAAEF